MGNKSNGRWAESNFPWIIMMIMVEAKRDWFPGLLSSLDVKQHSTWFFLSSLIGFNMTEVARLCSRRKIGEKGRES